ncbi:DUF1015 domain-containing protein [Desulfotruncus alcoholivorax]|uniref:DUF1015 domain-containing protein n=1 Tax=Desulfotruncus alcoholivorax TaxID=265477 RepID=UPI00042A2EAC|nr:DUF1015 domain-containing protein [Desulfotruncus alcoholivorax]
MAEIAPLHGLRYVEKKAGDIEDLVTPPYDVIDPKAQEQYYERNPYNIIRLEYGLKYPEDDEANNRYTRAAKFFSQWQEEGILQAEEKPAIYLYRQEFGVDGKTLIRSGIICRVKLEPYEKGVVLPHEETMPKHKADRYALMTACGANFSPVFGIYSDRRRSIDLMLDEFTRGTPPSVRFTDEWGHGHSLWVIDSPDAVQKVQKQMEPRQIFIADGHHRYETALKFARDNPNIAGAGFLMMTLVNLYDPGLVILPTHRLVTKSNLDQSQLIAALQEDFLVDKVQTKDAAFIAGLLSEMANLNEDEGTKGGQVFGLYLGNGLLYSLKLRDSSIIDSKMPAGRSKAWRALDVSVLQKLIFENILGIGMEELAGGEIIHYTRDAAEAMSKVDGGSHELAFIMNPTLISEVIEVATNGEKMPQKSTFFYPKLITGLVINKFM